MGSSSPRWQVHRRHSGWGAKRANDSPAGERHGGDAYWRLNRAHLNCLEFLPLFGAVVLVAAVTGVDTPTLDRLATLALVAPVGQPTTHLLSTSHTAVLVRFNFFVVQVLCVVGIGATLAA